MALQWYMLLALAVAAHAGPVSYNRNAESSTCATSCPENSKFSYETGKTYEYDYETDIKTGITGASDEHSSLHMRAVAMVEVLAPCEMVLKMTDVSLQDSSPTDYASREPVARMRDFKAAMQERSMRFAFRDGHVESVCAEAGEPTWVLNIKKAVVSHLQNTMESLDKAHTTTETDVAGECPVEYTPEGHGWSVTKVKKTKDLLGCTERLGHLTAFQSSPYKAHSAIQSMPLMKSTHQCDQEMNSDRVLISSKCVESHILRPFSRHESGAQTQITSKITFTRMTSGVSTRQGPVSKRSSLLFEHELSPEQREASVRQVQDTLSELCQASRDEITVEVPRLFAKLVRQMYPLDASTLVALYRESKTVCPKAEKFVRDAVPMLGSTGSVSLIRRLISSGDVTDMEADIWLTQLAFIAKPTVEMLAEIKPLLDLAQPFRKASLAVSTMVHSFCRQNPGCTEVTEVQEIIRLFEDKLRYNCKSDSEESHDQILMSLKALGNTGHANSAVQTLNRCFQNPEVSNEVRVAAIYAFRRMGCDTDRTEVMALFTNMHMDSELRIGAYLALMQCPDERTLERIQEMLRTEEVNQVGSFVWTHLTNLRETSSPHKQAIREILEDKDLQKTFDMDKRKYSRNVEMSYFSQLLNAGGEVDANLIWSQDSFVPRSAMVNLTVDVFGESVNLLELGGRAQGLERMLEKMFREQDNEIERTTALETISSIESRYNKKADEPQASYYLRIFGNEIRYGDLHDLDVATLKDRLNYLDWLIELSKEHNFEFTKSFMFLDATMTVPTIAGMPIRLNVDGTATVNIDVSGKLDMRNMFSSPSTFDIDGTVKPSAAIEVTGEMGVDAFVAKTGVKMISTVHTSTKATGKIQLKAGKVFNMEINAPEEETEILKAQSKFYIEYREDDREQRMLSEGRQEKKWCSGSCLGKVTGLELCAEASLPPMGGSDAPWFPMTGPASTTLILKKKDTFSSYTLDVKYIKDKVRRDGDVAVTETALFSFNTPGSQVDRELTLDFILNRGDMSTTFNLRTPWKKIEAESAITNTAEMKRAFGIVKMDGSTLFNLDAQLGINEKAVRTDYSPKLEVSWPGQDPIVLQGEVGYRAGKKAEIDLRLRNLASEPIRLQGLMSAASGDDTWKYETEMEVKSGLVNGKVSSASERAAGAINSHLTVEYAYKSGPQHKMAFTEAVNYATQGDKKTYTIASAWTSTLWPAYDWQGNTAFSYDSRSMNYNMDYNSGQTSLTVSSEATFNLQGANKQLEGSARITCPAKNMDYSGRVEYVKKANQLKTVASVQYAPNKEVSMEMNLEKESSKPLAAKAALSVSCPATSLSLKAVVQEQGNSGYHHDLTLEKDSEQLIRVTSTYQKLPRHELSADIIVPGVQPFTVRGHLNPDIRNLQAAAELTQAGRTYKAEGKWLHSGAAAAFTTRGDLTLACPVRTIIMEGSCSRQGDVITTTMETKWDAEKDAAKKMSVTGQVTVTGHAPAIQMKVVVFPEHSIDLDVSGKYETQGWYKTDSDVEGRMRLRTSFPKWEDISASFKHDRTKTEYKTEGEMSWAPGKTIEGRFDINKLRSWNKVETVLDLKTPVEGMRTVKAEVTYNMAASKLSELVKLQWDQKVMTVEMRGEWSAAPHMLKANMKLNSPFENWEDISATANYNDDGAVYGGNADLSWARNKQVSAQLEMQRQASGTSLANSGSLMVGTPFEGYTLTKVTWDAQKEAGMVKCSGGLESEGVSVISTVIESKMKTTGRSWTLKGESMLQSKWNKDIAIRVDHKHDNTNFNAMESEASAQWGEGKTISYEHKMQRSDEKPLSYRAKFTSPIQGLEKVSLDSQTTAANGRFVSEHEVKYGANNKIAATADMQINGWTAQGNIQLTTPLAAMEKLIINFQNAKHDDVWVSHGEVEYAPGKKMEVDTQLGLAYRKVVSVHVRSPIPHLRDASAAVTATGTKRNFEATVEAKHEEMAGDVIVSVTANTADPKDMKLIADVKTPWAAMRSVKAVWNNKMEGESYHIDSLIETPTTRRSFTQDLTSRNGRAYNLHTVLEYAADQKIDVTAEIKMARRTMGSLTWQSPFTEQLTLEFNHEGVLKVFSSNGEVRYGSKTVAGNMDFSLQGTTLIMTGRLTTPFMDARRIVMAVNHEGPATDFKNSASIQVNDLSVSGNSELKLRADDVRVKAELRTPVPISGYSSFGVDLTHRGPKDNFNNEAVITFGSKRVNARSQFSLRGSAMDVTASLELPIPQMNTVAMEIHHNGPATAFTNNAVITYGEKRISGNSEFNLRGDVLSAKAALQLPVEALRTLEVELAHRGPAKAFSNQATIKYNDEVISANSEFSLGATTLTGKVNVRTPFPEAKKLGLELSHEGPIDNFRCGMLATYNRKEVKGDVQFGLRGTSLTAKANLAMPMRTVSLEVTHTGPITDFSNSLLAKYGSEEVSANSQFLLRGNTLKAKAEMVTACPVLRTVSVEVNHQGPAKDFSNSAIIKYSDKVISANSLYKLAGNTMRAEAAINIPHASVPTVSMAINHEGPAMNFQNSAILTYGAQVVKASSQYSLQGTTLRSKVALELPADIKIISLEVNHNGPWTSFNNDVTLTIGDKQISTSGQMTLGDKSVDANMQLRSPYPAVRRVVVALKHEGPINSFKNSGEISVNGKAVSGNSEFSLRGHSLSAKAGLRMPVREMSNIELVLNHNGPADSFNNNAVLTIGDQQYSATSELAIGANSIAAKANVKIPVDGGDISFELNHNGPWKHFRNNVMVSNGVSSYAASSEFSLRGNTLTAKADVACPHTSLRMEASHSGEPLDFQNSALVAYGSTEIRANSQFKLGGSTIMAKAEMTMPYGPGKVAIEVNHDGTWTNFNNNGVVTYGDDVVSATSQFSLEGTTVHAKAELRMPVKGLKVVGIELRHSGSPKNFNCNAMITYGKKQISSDVEFSLNGAVLAAKISAATPFPGYETLSAELTHDGSLSRFRNGITIRYGRNVLSAENEFKIEGNVISGKVTIHTPHEAVRNIEVTFEHDGRSATNFNNNGMLKYNGERYTGESEFRWYGRLFRLNAEVNIPEKYSIKVNHKGTPTDFSNNMKIQLPNNRISGVSSLKLAGKTMEGSANIETTYNGLRNMGISVNHEGDAGNFRTKTDIVTPFKNYKNFGTEVTHKGTAGDFESSLHLTSPFTGYQSVAGTVTHKRTSNNCESTYSVSADGKSYNGKAAYKKLNRGLEAELSAETPWTNMERTAATFAHSGDLSNFRTSGSVETSVPAYNRFSGELSHSGDTMTSQTTAKVQTPFRSLPSLTASISHDCKPRAFSADVSAEYSGKSLSGAASYKRTDSGVEASTSLRTPYQGYERFAAAMAHSKTASGLETSASMETPFRSWERTSGKLTHTGSPNNFRTGVEATTSIPDYSNMALTLEHNGNVRDFQTALAAITSIPGYERFGANVNHAVNPTGFKSGAAVSSSVRGYENFGTTFEKSGDLKKMNVGLTVTTPVAKYENMGIRMSHDLSAPRREWSGEVTSSYPGYEKFGASLNHEGDLNEFRSAAEATSTMRGYERFAAGVEKKGPLDNLQIKSHVETPFEKYERMAMELTHAGHARDFATAVKVETTIPHYSRMAANYAHKGHANKFDCTGAVETSYPGYERVAGSLSHEGDLNSFKTTGSLETPFRGHENLNMAINHNNGRSLRSSVEVTGPGKRYAASVNHMGDLKKFDTTLKVNTPFAGYERFGLVMNHDMTDGISHTGVISLPFRELPEIKYTVSHSGHLYDFTSAATVEYANKKIEATGFYKRIASYAETIYEGGMTMSSPYESLRNLRLTGATHRRSDAISGSLDLIHNDAQKLDMDYSYTYGDAKTVTINVRNPKPFETSFTFNAENGNVLAEGSVNWNPKRAGSKVRGKFDMKCQGNSHEVDVTLSLPSRDMAVKTKWEKTTDSLSHSTSLQWADDEASKFNYELVVSRSSRRNQELVDGSFKLVCAGWSVDSALALKKLPGRYTSELTITTDKTIKVSTDVTINGANRKCVITLSHPSMRRDAVLSIDSTIDAENHICDGTVELKVDRETIIYSGRVAREAPGKYAASTRLAHPNSLTDFQWSGVWEYSAERVLHTQEAKWMTSADQQFKIATLRADIDKVRKELTVQAANPLGELSIAGRQVSAQAGVYNYAGEVTLGRRSVRVETELNKPKKSADIKVFYTQNDYLHAYAKFLSQTEVQAEVYRVHNGERIQEAEIHLKQKEDSRSFTGRTFIRPDIMEDIKGSMETTEVGREWMSAWRSVRGAWREEMSYKKPALERSLRPVIKVYKQAVAYINDYFSEVNAKVMAKYEDIKAKVMAKYSEMKDQYKTKYAEMKQKVKDMYAENTYYMKDICVWMQNAVTVTKERYSSIKTQVRDASAVSSEYVSDWWTSLLDATKDLKTKVESLSIDDLQPHMDKARSTVTGWVDQVRDHPSVRRVVDHVTTLRDSWASASPDAAAVVSSQSPGWMNYAKEMWTQMARREDIKAVRDYIGGHIQKSKWTADYLRVNQMARDLLEDIKSSGIKGIIANVKSWIIEIVKPERNLFTVWDPQGGDFQFDLYVPLPLNDLQTMPKVTINLSKYARTLRDMYTRYRPEQGWDWCAVYYKYKPSTHPRDWIPPFDAHASVSGRQHFMTFDKRFYEFAGECSYLLASDFIDGAFSVLVNYERTSGAPTKKSITVVLGDKQLEVFPDGRVILDNARVELPISLDDKLLMVRDGGLIKMENVNGISLECDLNHDRCTVTADGWYFGRTAGLFGTYNNEAYDDMTTIDHRRVDNVGEFAASWATGSRCRPINSAVDISNEVNVEHRRYQMCAKYLQETGSPFSRCFGAVDPAPFMRMCLNDMPTNVNEMDKEKDVCDVASHYVSECAMHQVPIRLPSICVRCQVEGGQEFWEGQNITLKEDQVPESADVVFIIHHSDCNREMVEQLKDLVDDMEKAFKTETMKNTRYALVGYGGQGVHAVPHTHTMDGQIFNGRDKILLGLENFDTVAGEDEDAFSALKFASLLPFRAGVSKNLILMPCQSCRQGPVKFSEIQQMLLFRDIRLHVLLQHNFELRSSSPKTAYIFGMDRDVAYTRKDAGTTELEGDADLRRQLRVPKDLCVALTEETDGSVFNTLQWINNRPFVQKRYRDVLVRVIADKAEPTDCQICECTPDNTGAGMATCRSCEPPEPIYAMPSEFTREVAEMAEVADVEAKPEERVGQDPISPAKIRQMKRLNAKKQRQARRLRLARKKSQQQS